jgi:hypothetical protein
MKTFFTNITDWISNKYKIGRFLLKVLWNSGKILEAVKAFPKTFKYEEIRVWVAAYIAPAIEGWCAYAKTTAPLWDDYLSEGLRRMIVELWNPITIPVIDETVIIPTPSTVLKIRTKIKDFFQSLRTVNENGEMILNGNEPTEKETESLATAAIILSIIVNGAAAMKYLGERFGLLK